MTGTPTMTPAEIADWERQLAAGDLFRTIRPRPPCKRCGGPARHRRASYCMPCRVAVIAECQARREEAA